MKYFILAMMAASFYPYTCNAQTANYVKIRTYLDNMGNAAISSTQYYDGIGRPFITATNGLSGEGNHIYTLQEYDGLSRETRTWFPVVGTQDLTVPTSDKLKEPQLIYNNDSHACSSSEYDALSRKTILSRGGDDWNDNEKVTVMKYGANKSGEVIRYKITGSSLDDSCTWPEGSLTCETVTDEDGHATKTYKNLSGQKIMVDNAGSKTYYVYNDYGLLSYVLTPSYQKEQDLDRNSYRYEYDDFHRIRMKKLPGCDSVTYAYDDVDRVIFTQDGLLRSKGLYRISLYDKLGRVAIQGTTAQYDERFLKASTVTRSGSPGFLGTGYNMVIDIVSNINIEIVNYYDDHDFIGVWNGRTDVSRYRNDILAGTTYARGSLTGQMVATTDGQMLYNVFYYDQKGRLVDERRAALSGDVYKVTTEYSFTDKPTHVTRVIPTTDSDSFTIENNMEYNSHNDMLKTSVVNINSKAEETVSSFSYTDIGQIRKESRANGADEVSYEYDLHGWTTSITSPFFSEELQYARPVVGSTPCFNGNISSLIWKACETRHAYGFSYDDRDMLSEAKYAEMNQTSAFEECNKYDESATYNDNGSIATLARWGKNNAGNYSAIDLLTYKYDGNLVTNISDRIRTKLSYKDAFEYRDNHSSTTSPDFAYNGNGMLTKDLDKSISTIVYNDIGLVDSIRFTNGNSVRYVYDMTGQKLRVTHYTAQLVPIGGRLDLSSTSLTAARSVTATTSTTTSTTTSATSTSATSTSTLNSATSLSSTVTQMTKVAVTSAETLYLGSDVQFDTQTGTYTYLFGNGYAEFNSTDKTAEPQFFYYTKDHLGNVRNVITKNEDSNTMEEVQRTSYYPFGGIIVDDNMSFGRSEQDRTYNGKEQDFANSLFWLDYGARQYDPTRGQFTTPDPLAEKYYSTNYFTYCMNNPMKFIDPIGESIWIYYLDGNGNKQELEYSEGMTCEIDNKEVLSIINNLNAMCSNSDGYDVISSFIESETKYGYRQADTHSENAEGYFNITDNTIYLYDVNNTISFAEETFHAYQHLKGCGGQTAVNEVDAKLFSAKMNFEIEDWFSKLEYMVELGACASSSYSASMESLFFHGFNMEHYKNAVNNFFNGILSGQKYKELGYTLGTILEEPLIKRFLPVKE